MLSNIRHFVNFHTLKSIYQAILESHLNYSLTVWAQNANSIKILLILRQLCIFGKEVRIHLISLKV